MDTGQSSLGRVSLRRVGPGGVGLGRVSLGRGLGWPRVVLDGGVLGGSCVLLGAGRFWLGLAPAGALDVGALLTGFMPLCKRTGEVGRDIVASDGDMVVSGVVETAAVSVVRRGDGLRGGGEEGDEEGGSGDHAVDGEGRVSKEKKEGGQIQGVRICEGEEERTRELPRY